MDTVRGSSYCLSQQGLHHTRDDHTCRAKSLLADTSLMFVSGFAQNFLNSHNLTFFVPYNHVLLTVH